MPREFCDQATPIAMFNGSGLATELAALLSYHCVIERNARVRYYAKAQTQRRRTLFQPRTVSGLNEVLQHVRRQSVKVVIMATDAAYDKAGQQAKLEQLLALGNEQGIPLIKALSVAQLTKIHASAFQGDGCPRHGQRGAVGIIGLLMVDHILQEVQQLRQYINFVTTRQLSEEPITLDFSRIAGQPIDAPQQRRKQLVNPFSRKDIMAQAGLSKTGVRSAAQSVRESQKPSIATEWHLDLCEEMVNNILPENDGSGE